jgi:NADPH2:quinone reductase
VVRAVLVDVASAGLVVADVADPVARPGQLLVGVRAAGLNRADLAVRAGTHDRTRPGTARAAAPFVAGSELAGDVLAVGAGVEGWGTGDRVMGLGQGYAELAVIDARMAMPVPDGLTWEEAGALPVALLTMHDALVTNGRWRPGETVLVNAVTSGVGVIGAQLALHRGAPVVIGTSRTESKRRRLSALLADDRLSVLDPGDPSVQEEVRRLTGGHGVDVTIDNVGASAIQGCVEAAALLGRVVQVGRLGGRHGTIDLDELARKRLSIIGVTFRTRTPEERTAVVRAALDDIGGALASGALRPPVHATYPLADAVEAQDALARDEHLGKLVLVP